MEEAMDGDILAVTDLLSMELKFNDSTLKVKKKKTYACPSGMRHENMAIHCERFEGSFTFFDTFTMSTVH